MHDSEIKAGERVKDVRFTEDTIAVDLLDGRTIIFPLDWYGAGYGIRWPDLDEDLSTEGLLRGAPSAPEPAETRA